MKRRTFLWLGLTAAGALVVAYGTRPPRQRLRGKRPLDTVDGQVALNGWLKIAADDTITVVCPKAEMGQGVWTAAAMLLAEELDADLARVKVEPSPMDPIYNNIAAMVDGLPFHPDDTGRLRRTARWITAKWMREFGSMMTGGSSSVADLWEPLRDAGAMAREAMKAAAAAQWNVPVTTVRTEGGAVINGQRRLTYGALAPLALAHLPKNWTRKEPIDYRLLGRAQVRVDGADKATGRAVFGIDAGPGDALAAAVAFAPSLGATVARFEADVVRGMPGVQAVVPLPAGAWGHPAGVAVVADSWWQAQQAVAALPIEWAPGAGREFSTAQAATDLDGRITRGEGRAWADRGDLLGTFTRAAFSVEGTYRVPYLAHAPMEPPNCTARVSEDGVDVWTGTQVPGFAVKAAADVAGVPADRVRLHQTLLGGGFGRRLVVDVVAAAVATAKELPGRAVRLLYSREQDIRHGLFRPMVHAKLQGALDVDGRLTALNVASAGQAQIAGWGKWVKDPLLEKIPDKTTVEGLVDQPYALPVLRVVHDTAEFPVPVGSWRSVGHSYTAFFLESFLDECAAARQRDPVAFREELLAGHPRAVAVLRLAAERSGWGTPLAPAPAGSRVGRGLALHWSFQAYVAHVAEVEIAPDDAIRVRRVVVAADCGFVVNPDGARQQIESGVIFGLSAALHGAITFENGAVQQSNFHDYRPLRLGETPVIETHFVNSGDEEPGGVGEVAVPGIAPAVANAIFAAGGGRIRTLPLSMANAEGRR